MRGGGYAHRVRAEHDAVCAGLGGFFSLPVVTTQAQQPEEGDHPDGLTPQGGDTSVRVG
jgi:hypothetical protein